LAKNNKFSHDFLLKWSLYEHKIIPKSFQAIASDNAAIHVCVFNEKNNILNILGAFSRRTMQRVFSKKAPFVYTALGRIEVGEFK
jgi:hypothetical protein